jgi:hypothetical protein
MSSLQALADIRQKIQETESKIAEIENASLPADDVAERIKTFVATLQARFDADYIGRCLTSPGAGISTTDILNACSIEESSTADRHLVLAAWLNPDLLERKLTDAAMPYVATGKQALPVEKRPALLRKLDEQLTALLADEERLIVELQADGHEVFRRSGIDPLIVLGATGE